MSLSAFSSRNDGSAAPCAVLLVGEIAHDVEADPRQAAHALRNPHLPSSPRPRVLPASIANSPDPVEPSPRLRAGNGDVNLAPLFGGRLTVSFSPAHANLTRMPEERSRKPVESAVSGCPTLGPTPAVSRRSDSCTENRIARVPDRVFEHRRQRRIAHAALNRLVLSHWCRLGTVHVRLAAIVQIRCRCSRSRRYLGLYARAKWPASPRAVPKRE